MTKASERLRYHREMMQCELAAYERGIDVGSHESAARALERAANHAAILTALRSIASKESEGLANGGG